MHSHVVPGQIGLDVADAGRLGGLDAAVQAAIGHELGDQHGLGVLDADPQEPHDVLGLQPLQHCHLHPAAKASAREPSACMCMYK